MVEKTRREQELQGLYSLRRDQQTLERRKKDMEKITQDKASVDRTVLQRTESRMKRLPTNHASTYRAEIDEKIEKARKRKERRWVFLISLLTVILGAFMVRQIVENEGVQIGDSIAKSDIFSSLYFVVCYTMILTCTGSTLRVMLKKGESGIDCLLCGVFCLFIWIADSIAVHVTAFAGHAPDSTSVIISAILGILATIFVILPLVVLIGGAYVSFVGMSVINSAFVIIPAVMIVLALVSIFLNVKGRKYTNKEQQILAEKQALDKKNEKENANKEGILLLEAGVSQGSAYQAIERRRKQCQDEIDELQKEIANNGWLYGDDIQWTDKVISYMQSGRADTIKEALHLVDMEQERARQRKLDEQRHKEMMEEIEYQSWEVANMRAEQREAAERAEKALRESEAAAERARYDAEMRAYEEAWKEEQHRQNVEWELRKRRDG